MTAVLVAPLQAASSAAQHSSGTHLEVLQFHLQAGNLLLHGAATHSEVYIQLLHCRFITQVTQKTKSVASSLCASQPLSAQAASPDASAAKQAGKCAPYAHTVHSSLAPTPAAPSSSAHTTTPGARRGRARDAPMRLRGRAPGPALLARRRRGRRGPEAGGRRGRRGRVVAAEGGASGSGSVGTELQRVPLPAQLRAEEGAGAEAGPGQAFD